MMGSFATLVAIFASWWSWESYVQILPRKEGRAVDGFTPQLQLDLRRICWTGRVHCLAAVGLCCLFAVRTPQNEMMALAGAFMLMVLAPSWWNLKFETPRFSRLIRLAQVSLQSGLIVALVGLAWVYQYGLAVPLAVALLAHWRTLIAIKALVAYALHDRDTLQKHANRVQAQLQQERAFANDTQRKAS